jgi:two-component system LytT family sensor kinase
VRRVVVQLIVSVIAAAVLIAVTAVALARERQARRIAEAALAELEASRSLAAQAKLDFLRAQISPHFIHNALTAIASYVRSDPERARDLLADFAEFMRRSFREQDQNVTLAEEFRFVDIYLDLERARFGDRLAVSLRVAPGVLSVEVPSLVLQPLVENAVRHGLGQPERHVDGQPDRNSDRIADRQPGRNPDGNPDGENASPSRPGIEIWIAAADEGGEAVVTVADDGAGADPRVVEDALAGRGGRRPVGLRNVDERLRAIYGDEYGLAVETGVGAGMKVTMRLPKRRVPARVPAGERTPVRAR